MARKTSKWTLRKTNTRHGDRSVSISVEWDSPVTESGWAVLYTSVDGGSLVRTFGRIKVNRLGRFGVRRDRWGYPVIGAAQITSVTVQTEDGEAAPVEGKNIKAAVEAWASAVASSQVAN